MEGYQLNILMSVLGLVLTILFYGIRNLYVTNQTASLNKKGVQDNAENLRILNTEFRADLKAGLDNADSSSRGKYVELAEEIKALRMENQVERRDTSEELRALETQNRHNASVSSENILKLTMELGILTGTVQTLAKLVSHTKN